MAFLQEYLSRLKLEGNLPAKEIDLISHIHLNHTFQIPFENLDIILGKTPSLELSDIKEKFFGMGRGGYCFELNGLFLSLLKDVGIEGRYLNARIVFGTKKIYFRGHMLIMFIQNKSRYIADVGYRFGLLMPIPLKCGIVFKQFSEQFRLLKIKKDEYSLQKIVDQTWQDLYIFTTEEFIMEDFVPMNYYNSHCKESIFTNTSIVSIKNPLGNVSMIGNMSVSMQSGVKTETIITSALGYQNLLQEKFNLRMDIKETEKIFLFNATKC